MCITNQDLFLISNSQNTKPEIQWLTTESVTMSTRCVYVANPSTKRPRERGEGYITLYSLDNYAN